MKILFLIIFILSLFSSCTTTENQSVTTYNEYSSQNISVNQSEDVDTIFLGVEEKNEQKQSEIKKNPEYIKGSQLPSIIQNLYEKAEKVMQDAAQTINEDKNEKTTFFYDETEIGKYFAKQSANNQTITFTPSLFEPVSIKGKQGTIITFLPASLIDENGNPVTKPVQIELKELYHLKDALFQNLSTTAEDVLLETVGSVFIKAYSEGKPLRLLATRPILLEMPTQQKKEKMELFYGEKMPASGKINWHVMNTVTKQKYENEDIAQFKTWENSPKITKKYELGDIELCVNLKDMAIIDGKPSVHFSVKNIHPKLEKYKKIIENTLNQVSWEKDQKAKSSGKSLYERNSQCLLGNVIFANVIDLWTIREEIAKYKNYSFERKIPIQAHLNKDFYYKKKGLMNDYVFDRASWQQDSRFFEDNFPSIKEKKTNVYEELIAEMQANQTALLDAYSAHYAVSYLFTTNQLGWLTCGRYDATQHENMNLMVNYEGAKTTDIKLIIPEQGIIIPARDLGKKVVFSYVPKGKKAILFGIKLVADVPFFCLKEIVIGKEKNVEMTDFQQMSMPALEQKMIDMGIIN